MTQAAGYVCKIINAIETIYVLEVTEDLLDVVATGYVRRTCTRRQRAGWLVPDQRISYEANDCMFHCMALVYQTRRKAKKRKKNTYHWIIRCPPLSID